MMAKAITTTMTTVALVMSRLENRCVSFQLLR